MMSSVNISDDTRPSPSSVPSKKSPSLLSKQFGEYSDLAKLQIEKMRLKFLRSCTPLKRPPPSLRINGSTAIDSSPQKLLHFSQLESKMLGLAITKKINEVRFLSQKVSKSPINLDPLSPADLKALQSHFDKKISFLKKQCTSKWKSWPRKPQEILSHQTDKKTTNFKRRDNKRRRKVEKLAKKALKEGSVIVLIDTHEIPLGAISVLSKGLGFVPTPKVDVLQTRLDMRRTTNSIVNSSRKSSLSNNNSTEPSNSTNEDKPSSSPEFKLPSKLKKKNYNIPPPTEDKDVNDIIHSMESELDQILQTSRPSKHKPNKNNLIPIEQTGLKWLEKMVSSEQIAITPADKGGSILIVDPKLLRRKTSTGLGPTNRPSTAPHHKPGKSYFYPSLKVHKLKKEQLIPGVEPPVRLITALQEGISKKSDVFVATKYLRPLEKDFCQDLLTDTTDALIWLDKINDSRPQFVKKTFKSFTFDFKGLYDSLSPSLVIEALRHAMNQLRPDWSENFKAWLIDLVNHSLKSSIGFFEDTWYRQIHGVPTGGSLCVQLANIAVFYVLDKLVYSNQELMRQVSSVKRYIDDGAGQFTGSARQFSTWINKVNEAIAQYGLEIDEFQVENPGDFVSFLDIKYTFDEEGNLQTDLHVKETDSRSYLHFSSSHPNHIFSGIVYSQCLRLRRVINSNERLKKQLDILKEAFLESGYPKKMVENIANKVLGMERVLQRKNGNPMEQAPPLPIRVISSYGSDDDLVNVVQKYEPHLRHTRSFSDSECPKLPGSTTNQKEKNKLFQFVKKTGSSLRSRLVTSKQLALGSKHGKTEPCHKKNCKCCNMILDKDSITVNGRRVKSAPGTCKNYNIIYLVQCSICKKNYVGRSVNSLH